MMLCSQHGQACFAISQPAIAKQQHGGVGIYCQAQLEYDILDIPNVSTECISCHFIREDMIVVVIYSHFG